MLLHVLTALLGVNIYKKDWSVVRINITYASINNFNILLRNGYTHIE
jgi:hypothetical protein